MNSSEEDGECSPKKLSTSILENMIPTMKLCGPTTPGELEELIDSNDDKEKEKLKNEINDILEDENLKNKLLEMIVHEWPILNTAQRWDLAVFCPLFCISTYKQMMPIFRSF